MSSNYQKFTYWLTEDEFAKFQERASQNDLSLYRTKKAVCVPLSKRIEVGYVEPETWEKFDICKNQISWYKESRLAGQILVVSSIDLADYDLTPETIIRHSKFKPPKLADENDKQELMKQLSYQQSRPVEWESFSCDITGATDKWRKVMGVRNITDEELFNIHSANHANFIEPVFYIEEEDGVVPYSVCNKTKHVCSACLEFYNIIGAKFKKKLVVPCPGASIFGGLPVNKYLEVITIAQKTNKKIATSA